MTDRTVRLVVVYDPNSAESRAMMETLTENTFVETIELQRVQGILPGVRAVPAVGVVMWANDLQGIATDVDNFNAYLKHEEDVFETLDMLRLGVVDDDLVARAADLDKAIQTAAHYLPDDVAAKLPAALYAGWCENNVAYIAGDLRIFNGDLYRCRGNHISDASHDPVNAPSLWRKLPWANVE